jgi:hypothetical protein
MERVRRKLAGADDGNRQMVDILTAVLTDGLPAVEAGVASHRARAHRGGIRWIGVSNCGNCVMRGAKLSSPRCLRIVALPRHQKDLQSSSKAGTGISVDHPRRQVVSHTGSYAMLLCRMDSQARGGVGWGGVGWGGVGWGGVAECQLQGSV